jgi:hypothetical protein
LEGSKLDPQNKTALGSIGRPYETGPKKPCSPRYVGFFFAFPNKVIENGFSRLHPAQAAQNGFPGPAPSGLPNIPTTAETQ